MAACCLRVFALWFSLFVLLQRPGLSLTGFRSLLSKDFPSHTHLKLHTLTSVLEFCIFVFCILLLHIIYLYLINCISSIYLFIVYPLNQNASSMRQGHMEPFSCSTNPWDSMWYIPRFNLPANTGDIRDMGSIPGLGKCPGGGHNNPLQYSCLEIPMDRGTWQAAVHRIT